MKKISFFQCFRAVNRPTYVKFYRFTKQTPVEPEHETIDEESKDYKYSADGSPSDSETVHDYVHEKGPTQLQTPGTSSSGYISEAFSTSNLTNDDSISIKSNTGDFTPDKELDACEEPSVTDVSKEFVFSVILCLKITVISL